ncbi:MAG: polysaccharide deacetylase family protein, partial [Coriobacteriaceae bacterium]|nr:polysaccharide deacetylase family protein [Coriobacteriaceae bacterium]
ALFREIVNRGHAIGLHTNSHVYGSIYSSDEAFFLDLETISRRVEAVVGFAPKIMRFAGGSSNTVSAKYSRGIMTRLVDKVHERGYRYYDWNCSTGDGGNVTTEQEIENVKAAAGGKGPLYLLAHDTKPQTLEAMKTIIPYLLSLGYSFEPITESTPEYRHSVAN